MTGRAESLREAAARLRWFAEMGDMKPWGGPAATVATLREAFRADVEAALNAVKVLREALRGEPRECLKALSEDWYPETTVLQVFETHGSAAKSALAAVDAALSSTSDWRSEGEGERTCAG